MSAKASTPEPLPTQNLNGLRYYDSSPGDHGPAYLLFHGLGNSLEFWVLVAPLMRDSGRVIAVDLPGFGQSATPAGGSLKAYVAPIEDLLTSLHINSVHLIGHSFGAFVAMEFIAQLPTVVSRVTLVDGTLFTALTIVQHPRTGVRDPKIALNAGLQFLGGAVPLNEHTARLIASNSLVRQVILWPYVQSPSRLDSAYLPIALSNNGGLGAILAYRLARSVDIGDLLAKVNCPVQLVWGADDRLINRSDIDRAQGELKIVKTLAIPDCGHWPMLEKPDALATFLIE
jgi:pimeloyl-ACP methyl ester carboxylesterase